VLVLSRRARGGRRRLAYDAPRKTYAELQEKGRIACDPAEVDARRHEINAIADLPRYQALEARTVET
jgi:hypothetical protein